MQTLPNPPRSVPSDGDQRRTDVRGWWTVYSLSLGYGGPEEGGWWYDRGEAIALVPAVRPAIEEWSESDSDSRWYERDGEWSIVRYEDGGETPAHVAALCDRMVADGFGQFDGEYRSTRPRHDSLSLRWVRDDGNGAPRGFPESRPVYE